MPSMNLDALDKNAVRSHGRLEKVAGLDERELRRVTGGASGPSNPVDQPICPEPTCPIHDWYPYDAAL